MLGTDCEAEKPLKESFKGMVQTCSTLRICLGKEHFFASYFHVHHGTGVLIQSHYTLHFPLSISFSQVWNHQDLRSG